MDTSKYVRIQSSAVSVEEEEEEVVKSAMRKQQVHA
jgi:hypothetical protein